ncbi:hypothetical protein H4S02_003500 [Coemansia sp. RSA 2611]|nr:hypothetical protein H4S02_003500 [Coemansia sp. RSA 2611]
MLRPLRHGLRQVRQLSTGRDGDKYVEAAKRQLREYQSWRRHFVWRRDRVVSTLRDYTLWSLLALLAYHNLTQRQRRNDYDAQSFVTIDRLEEQIHARAPASPVLAGSIHQAPAAPPARATDRSRFF